MSILKCPDCGCDEIKVRDNKSIVARGFNEDEIDTSFFSGEEGGEKGRMFSAVCEICGTQFEPTKKQWEIIDDKINSIDDVTSRIKKQKELLYEKLEKLCKKIAKSKGNPVLESGDYLNFVVTWLEYPEDGNYSISEINYDFEQEKIEIIIEHCDSGELRTLNSFEEIDFDSVLYLSENRLNECLFDE